MNGLRCGFVVFGLAALAACSADGPSGIEGGGNGAGNGGASPPSAVGAPQCTGDSCLEIGGFSEPFAEPGEPTTVAPAVSDNRLPLENPLRIFPNDDRCAREENGRPIKCKPAAASIALLGDDRLLYFNALEGTEDVEFSVFFEAGAAIMNDQTRVMRLLPSEARWTKPSPVDAGANPEGYDHTLLLPDGLIDNAAFRTDNDGALFCSDLEFLADGRLIAVGGTDYYNEPGVSTPIVFGVSELEGLRNARIFNPADNTWQKTGDMHYGRWYPSLVTLPSGDLFVASGVTKLLKPVYPERPTTSGRNVVETETYDLGCGTWQENGGLAQRSLPLFPRLHLLPNGHVLYNAAGQAFNPFGQSYDQPLWNIVATYDPEKQMWSDLAYAGTPLLLNRAGLERLGSALNPTNPNIAADIVSLPQGLLGKIVSDPTAILEPFTQVGGPNPADPASALGLILGTGFRGSAFSIMLPLEPDEHGEYRRAEFLTAGGVLGAVVLTSPGTYLSTDLGRIDSVTIRDDNSLDYVSRVTGSLNRPRWYGTGVLLPTGEVMVFSGAERDEVVLPGSAGPIRQAELFNPETETWRPMATARQARTYHNTALLLPDGRVLVGGHAPINTAYLYQINLPGMSPNDGRDPSFEIYSPPYAFKPRPQLSQAPDKLRHGQSFSVASPQAGEIESVVLVRRTSITHLIDGDQRSVELAFTRSGNALNLRLPANHAVVPPGPYLLFVNQRTEQGLVPSESKPVTVLGADTTCE